jgi:hypothetical protein
VTVRAAAAAAAPAEPASVDTGAEPGPAAGGAADRLVGIEAVRYQVSRAGCGGTIRAIIAAMVS